MSDKYATYQAVLDYIDTLHNVEVDNQKNKRELELLKEYLASNWELISKFKKAEIEIGACLEKDDREAVKQYIEMLKQMDSRISETRAVVGTIMEFSNRYNKKEVIDRFAKTVDEIHEEMGFAEVEKYRSLLEEVENSVQMVVRAFDRECQEVLAIKRRLEKNRPPEMWKEDRDRLLEAVKAILAKDVRKMDFDLGELKAGIEEVVDIRKKDIQDTVDKYNWLTKGDYDSSFKELISKALSYSDFQSGIDVMVRGRNASKGLISFAWILISVFIVCLIVMSIIGL